MSTGTCSTTPLRLNSSTRRTKALARPPACRTRSMWRRSGVPGAACCWAMSPKPRIAPRMLLKSCAIPPASVPSASMRCACCRRMSKFALATSAAFLAVMSFAAQKSRAGLPAASRKQRPRACTQCQSPSTCRTRYSTSMAGVRPSRCASTASRVGPTSSGWMATRFFSSASVLMSAVVSTPCRTRHLVDTNTVPSRRFHSACPSLAASIAMA